MWSRSSRRNTIPNLKFISYPIVSLERQVRSNKDAFEQGAKIELQRDISQIGLQVANFIAGCLQVV